MRHWKHQAAQRLPNIPPQPRMVHQVELDELYTFVGEKKWDYVVTAVDRMTHMIMEWNFAAERTGAQLQAFVDRLPATQWYSTDGFEPYGGRW